eukprot:6319258-Pyramimonas_sp.AAC.1
MDLNSTCGKQQRLCPDCGEEDSEVDGPNVVSFRPVLRVHALVFANTFSQAGPTYWGVKGG